jgi:hypothetical protein
MQTLTIREASLSWANGRRRHHNGGYVDIYSPQQSNVSSGDTITLPPPASTASWVDGSNTQHQANFCFMSIGGGTNGAVFYTADDLLHGHAVPGVTVGNADINAVSIYLEPGGSGPGGPGLYVDALDVTSGQFIDNDFVEVTDNGSDNISLSASVNYDGCVATQGVSNEHVLAFQTIGTMTFDEWQSLSGTESIVGDDLTVGTNSSGYYLALYLEPVPSNPPKGNFGNYSIWQWVDYGTMVDGGPHPWNPYIEQLASGVAMAVNAKASSPKLRKQIVELAAKQVGMAAESIQKSILESGKQEK